MLPRGKDFIAKYISQVPAERKLLKLESTNNNNKKEKK